MQVQHQGPPPPHQVPQLRLQHHRMQVQHQGLKVVIEELGGQVHLVAAGGAEFKSNQLHLEGFKGIHGIHTQSPGRRGRAVWCTVDLPPHHYCLRTLKYSFTFFLNFVLDYGTATYLHQHHCRHCRKRCLKLADVAVGVTAPCMLR